MEAEQDDELAALESIFPEHFLRVPASAPGHLHGAAIYLDLKVESSLSVSFDHDPNEAVQGSGSRAADVTVDYLPRVELQIQLPESYPYNSAPQIEVKADWLKEGWRSSLQESLRQIWDERREQILFVWIDFITNAPDIVWGGGRLQLAPQWRPLLLQTDQLMKRQAFESGSYRCGVCLSPSLSGRQCTRLDCQHVFCKSCLSDYWSMSIEQGTWRSVICPSPECVKSAKAPSLDTIAAIVGDKLVLRYLHLIDKFKAESDPRTTYCPRPNCRTAVPAPVDQSDRLRICPKPSCSYAFCVYCRRTWHGAASYCVISATGTIVQEYMETGDNSPERTALEKKFGKKQLEKLVMDYANDQADQEWLKEHQTQCPNCSMGIQKSSGCNHMICSRCQVHFCHLCGIRLKPERPYDHFNTPSWRSCYGRLFAGITNSEEFEDWG